MNFLNTLAEKKVISQDDIPSIEEEARASGDSIETVLVRRGIDSDVVLAAKGEFLNLPTRNVSDARVPFETLSYIPEESARHYRVVPLALTEGVLEVGIVDPDNIEALDALNFISSKANLPFKVYLISEKGFEKVVGMYKGLTQEVGKALGELDLELAEKMKAEEKKRRGGGEEKNREFIREDAPVAKIVSNLFEYAVEGRASDIHIEPMAEEVRVRFRVDGVLHTALKLPLKVHSTVVSRIKILASLKLDEKRKPQDGRFSETVDKRRIDFRVSTFPTYYGEKVVMRILDSERGVPKLDDIGLSKKNLEFGRNAIARPYGIILISGPTGSGKTTTLYSMMNELDRESSNVLSLEDPVEYNIEGISQSQVRPEIGYTFATGLRTTLRQDPDIIMVGEIRDRETAELAIQAALTGHLVLSTIHTNNAIGVIPRLVEMGIDPYLIAPTLVLAMAQRLVSTLCEGTGKPIPVEGGIKRMLEKQFADLPEKYRKEIPFGEYVYDVEPTPECPTGTQGRIAVFEVLPIDSELEEVILKNPVDTEIERVARAKGMLTMKEDAILKALEKRIPFKEVGALSTEFLNADVAAEDAARKAEEEAQKAAAAAPEADEDAPAEKKPDVAERKAAE